MPAGYENIHHHLYIDNFYTSPALFTWLMEHGIYTCGMVRMGRAGFPRHLYFERGHHERGTAHYLSSGDLLAQSWIDSKDCLSTIHRAQYSVDTPEANRRVRRQSAAGAFDVPPYLLWLTVLAIMPKCQMGMPLLRMLISSWPLL